MKESSEKKRQAYKEAFNDLDEALKEFLYEFTKSIGIIKLVKMCPFLELKDWVKEKEKYNKNLEEEK